MAGSGGRSSASGCGRHLVLTGAGAGLRPGELFGLTVDRVDFLRRTIRVDQQLVRVLNRGVALGPLKTTASYRDVPLPTTVADALAAHLARWPAMHRLGLVFTNERAAPIQQSPFASTWATARRAAGLPGWATPHDLRHYYASALILRLIGEGGAGPARPFIGQDHPGRLRTPLSRRGR